MGGEKRDVMGMWRKGGEWPRVEDLGPATQLRDTSFPIDMYRDHCGGLTFGGDGKLYYVASHWRDSKYNPTAESRKQNEGVGWRLDPQTVKREEVARLEPPTCLAHSVSRGPAHPNGDLFFRHARN